MKKNTREKILHSFTRLVVRYGYEGISVVMLCHDAKVGKTSFYRYFRDKADVLDMHYRQIYDKAIQDEGCNGLEDLFTLLLKLSAEKPEERSMFESYGYNSYREFIYRYTYKMGKEIMKAGWRRELTAEEDFHLAFFCGGGTKIIEEWVTGKYRTLSARDAAKEIMKFISTKYRVAIDKFYLRRKMEQNS